LRNDAELIATAYELGPGDAVVEACPGWDVARLLDHVAYIHRWARFAVLNSRPPGTSDIAGRPDGTSRGDWLRIGATALADDLAAADPQADTWHVFPVEQKMWVWCRRQALETAVHRWDAEVATTGRSSLDPQLAGAGIAEYVDLGLPRILQRANVTTPRSSLHVHCTDVAGEWLLWADADGLHSLDEHRKGDAALRGSAEALLLVLMGRADPSALDIVGDPSVVDAWLGLPGW
jgi:uncharacterized protein (TIGR03083 family)